MPFSAHVLHETATITLFSACEAVRATEEGMLGTQ